MSGSAIVSIQSLLVFGCADSAGACLNRTPEAKSSSIHRDGWCAPLATEVSHKLQPNKRRLKLMTEHYYFSCMQRPSPLNRKVADVILRVRQIISVVGLPDRLARAFWPLRRYCGRTNRFARTPFAFSDVCGATWGTSSQTIRGLLGSTLKSPALRGAAAPWSASARSVRKMFPPNTRLPCHSAVVWIAVIEPTTGSPRHRLDSAALRNSSIPWDG